MELRIRPKNDFLKEADWQEIYVLARHWSSDLSFYKDEMKFLRHLIDKYFIWLVKDEHIGLVQSLSARLLGLMQQHRQLDDKLHKHISKLENLVEGPLTEDAGFRTEQSKLEDEITDFVKNFKQLKSEIFASTETVIESEKLDHLLSKQ